MSRDDEIERIKSARRAWARSLTDSNQARAWLDFYDGFWSTEEGREHLQKVADGTLKPLDTAAAES